MSKSGNSSHFLKNRQSLNKSQLENSITGGINNNNFTKRELEILSKLDSAENYNQYYRNNYNLSSKN